MKNTKFYLLSIVLLISLLAYQCNCPTCPQDSNIVIDDVDTVSFMIVTDDVDTVFVRMPIPKVQKLDSLFKYSIIIDDVDTVRTRIVTDDVDATRGLEVITIPEKLESTPTKQGQ